MKNKVLALFLCFVLVLGTNSIIFAQDTIQLESLPDDYFSNIYEYKYYENVRGTLTEDHDHQVFSWTVLEQPIVFSYQKASYTHADMAAKVSLE